MKKTIIIQGYRLLAVSLICVILVISGCATKQDVLRVDEKVNQIRIDQKLLNIKLGTIDSLMADGAEQDNRLRADLRSSVEDLNTQLSQLQSQISDLNQMLYTVMQQVQAGKAQTQTIPQEQVVDTSQTAGKTDSTEATQSSVDCHDLWDSAFKDMRRGQYDLALSGFSDYLKYCPNGPLADNSQFWVGECYYEMELHEQAIDAFKKLIETYPDTEKKASAIFKIGRSYEKLNNKDEALKYYLILQNDHPESLQYTQVKDKIAQWQKEKKK